MNDKISRDGVSMRQLAELYDTLVSLLEQAPAHGTLTMTIHMRDGIPHRFETTREESIFFRDGGR